VQLHLSLVDFVYFPLPGAPEHQVLMFTQARVENGRRKSQPPNEQTTFVFFYV